MCAEEGAQPESDNYMTDLAYPFNEEQNQTRRTVAES
jgi:hypothetical protein